jgi:host factor-I protein
MSLRDALTVRKLKSPPAEDTGMEASYLKGLGERQAQVTVKLMGGESMKGWVEYYDQDMIRLTRDGQPNLFIYKHDILYIAEETGRGR